MGSFLISIPLSLPSRRAFSCTLRTLQRKHFMYFLHYFVGLRVTNRETGISRFCHHDNSQKIDAYFSAEAQRHFSPHLPSPFAIWNLDDFFPRKLKTTPKRRWLGPVRWLSGFNTILSMSKLLTVAVITHDAAALTPAPVPRPIISWLSRSLAMCEDSHFMCAEFTPTKHFWRAFALLKG